MRKVVPLILAVVVVIVLIRLSASRTSTNTNTNTNTGTTPITKSPGETPTHGDSGPGLGATVEVPKPSDPAVAAVFEEMLAAWNKLPAFFAAVETSQPEAAGHSGRTKGKGKYLLQKKGDETLVQFDLRNDLRINQPNGSKIVTGEVLVTTIDGKDMYKFVNQPGHKDAVKQKINYDEVLQLGGPFLFRDLVTNNTLSLLPEEMKDNRATKVIKAKPKDGTWESIHYFDKATGIRVEMIELDAQGTPTLTIKVTEIDTNPTITEDSFKPVILEDVPPEDQSGD